MNKTNPLVIQFNTGQTVSYQDDVLQVPTYPKWDEYKTALNNAMQDHDSVILSYNNVTDKDRDTPKTLESLNIKTKSALRAASEQRLPAFNRYQNQLYFVNPTYNDTKEMGKRFVEQNDVVLTRRAEYPDKLDWEKHQAAVINRMTTLMPLSEGGQFDKTNHKAMLEDPKRGLDQEDLEQFKSWQANMPLIPELMGDDFVGIPDVGANHFPDLHVSFHGQEIPGNIKALKTVGLEGYMIPMRNQNGDAPKYQIGTDLSNFNLLLKARANDGVSIQKSEYLDSKGRTPTYKFKMNGKDSLLHVEKATNDEIIMADIDGSFKVPLKKDIKPILEERGYELPEIIDTLKPEPNAKYIWMSPGDMLGNKDINDSRDPEKNTISPSECGFIYAAEPRNGEDKYVVLVAEGALKGIIAAKYIDKKDANDQSLRDRIAGDKGVIVAQVPGVAKSFVSSVSRIYDAKPRKIARTLIAMDADGRDNLNVARGINSAYDELAQYNDGKVKVMSWDPDQKGIDDALIAASQHKTSIYNMNIHFGTAKELFPESEAKAPNPYRLDRTRALGRTPWVKEYRQQLEDRDKKVKAIQAESAPQPASEEDFEAGLESLAQLDPGLQP